MLADEIAAQVGGTAAAQELMQVLLLRTSIQVTLQRAAKQQVSDRVAYLREHLQTVPPSELQRLRRVAERRGHSVDDTHPPTHLRLAFLASLPPVDPQVLLSAEDSRAIDTEVFRRR